MISLLKYATPVWLKPVLIAGAVVAAVVAFLWYRASLIDQGRDEVQLKWDTAVAAAKAAQATENATATAETIKAIVTKEIVYRDRIKEIETYVPAPDTHCPVDSGFIRLYNTPSTASSTRTE